MTVIRDIIATTLRNHRIPYSDADLDEMAAKASADGISNLPMRDAVDKLYYVITGFVDQQEIARAAKSGGDE